MINVALRGIIRRWYLRHQIPIREIARRLDISRNTVRRYLRSETTEPSYAERGSVSGLGKYSVQLSGWLKAETTNRRRRALQSRRRAAGEWGQVRHSDTTSAMPTSKPCPTSPPLFTSRAGQSVEPYRHLLK